MILAIGVDSSIGLTKEKYFFQYKGRDFKYIPNHPKNRTDDLVGYGKSLNETYDLMTEFLSAFAYATDSRIIPHPGLSSPIEGVPLEKINITYGQRRSINAEELMDEICYIPPLKTKEQINLARLYREANAVNNVYFQILLYWHTLVYPSKNDDHAVAFIDDIDKDLPKQISWLADSLKRIKSNPVFSKDKKISTSLGNYMKNGIKHSISHIVRQEEWGVALELDSFEQSRHLYDVATFLKAACRQRLDTKYRMNAPHELAVFQYVGESRAK